MDVQEAGVDWTTRLAERRWDLLERNMVNRERITWHRERAEPYLAAISKGEDTPAHWGGLSYHAGQIAKYESDRVATDAALAEISLMLSVEDREKGAVTHAA